MSVFDLDNDGELTFEEIGAAGQMYAASKRNVNRLLKLILLLALLMCILLASVLGGDAHPFNSTDSNRHTKHTRGTCTYVMYSIRSTVTRMNTSSDVKISHTCCFFLTGWLAVKTAH